MTSSHHRWNIPNGVLAALLPFLGTATAYLFEFGYVGFYNIPATLIQIDLTRILKATGGLLLLIAPALMVAVLISNLIGSKKTWQRVAGRFLMSLFGSTVFALLIANDDPWWRPIFWFCLLHFLSEIVFLLNKSHEKKSSALKSATENEEKAPSLHSLADNYVVVPTALFFFCTVVVVSVGHFFASIQDRHWVWPNRPDMLLVSTYGDTAVFKKFDPQTRQIGTEVLIKKFSDTNLLRLNLIHTGRIISSKKASKLDQRTNQKKAL